jgi:hypothetical protein
MMVWVGAVIVLDKIIPHKGGFYWVLCIVSLLIIHVQMGGKIWVGTIIDVCLQKHVYMCFLPL